MAEEYCKPKCTEIMFLEEAAVPYFNSVKGRRLVDHNTTLLAPDGTPSTVITTENSPIQFVTSPTMAKLAGSQVPHASVEEVEDEDEYPIPVLPVDHLYVMMLESLYTTGFQSPTDRQDRKDEYCPHESSNARCHYSTDTGEPESPLKHLKSPVPGVEEVYPNNEDEGAEPTNPLVFNFRVTHSTHGLFKEDKRHPLSRTLLGLIDTEVPTLHSSSHPLYWTGEYNKLELCDAAWDEAIKLVNIRSTQIMDVTTLPPPDANRVDALRRRWFDACADLMGPIPLVLPPLREINHEINLMDDNAVYNNHSSRCPDALRPQLCEKIVRYVKAGWWELKPVPQTAPLLCIPKKDNGLRTVVDARQQNENTIKDVTPFPDQDTIHMDVARCEEDCGISLENEYACCFTGVHALGGTVALEKLLVLDLQINGKVMDA
ncbi:hypothetical protein C8J57DRAFT_1535064 [Mycena rebaudengoi]|nr:hypothetical protein C8J57DRAFT_1535064 [Mycena rebaudengoi]